ncbi:omptin family outer membrane protease [uncultured Shewanella sp.]|uniref:omptin family outer membrane protease n=1 Tax=uncultured Shewanella sp. TaxID=173975 RepID=UPI00345C4BD3
MSTNTILSRYPEVIAENNQLTFEGALGVLDGSSTEIVYESTGRKLSQLDWDINNVPIIKLGANWDLNEQWTFKGRFWSVVTNNGNAHMEDRDWLDSTQST